MLENFDHTNFNVYVLMNILCVEQFVDRFAPAECHTPVVYELYDISIVILPMSVSCVGYVPEVICQNIYGHRWK